MENLHAYRTVYAGTRTTTTFTTVISITSSQLSATIRYPQPAITEPISSVTYVLPTPNTYNSLFPPQTEVLLPVFVATAVVGIIESSGVPILTQTLAQGSSPSSQSLAIDVSGEVGVIRGCVGWSCWSSAEQIGLIVGVAIVILVILGACCWGLLCHLGYGRRRRIYRQNGRAILIKEPGRYQVVPQPRLFGHASLHTEGIQMRDFGNVVRPVTLQPTVPVINIWSPTTPTINHFSTLPGHPSHQVDSHGHPDFEDPERLSASYQYPDRHRHQSVRSPVLGDYMNLPEASCSTIAVVGHEPRSNEDFNDHNQVVGHESYLYEDSNSYNDTSENHYTVRPAGFAETISDSGTIAEEKMGSNHSSVDDEEHASAKARGLSKSAFKHAKAGVTADLKAEAVGRSEESGDEDRQAKAAKLARKAGKKVAPAVEEKGKERAHDYLESVEHDRHASTIAKVASKAAQKLAPTASEQLDRRLDNHANSSDEGRYKRHHHRRSHHHRLSHHHRRSSSGSDRHRGRHKHEHEHRYKSKGRKHRRSPRNRSPEKKKESKMLKILPLVLGIAWEILQPEGVWAKIFPKPHGDEPKGVRAHLFSKTHDSASESSKAGTGGSYVANAQNTPPAFYTPTPAPEASTPPQPDHPAPSSPRRSGRTHRRQASTPPQPDNTTPISPRRSNRTHRRRPSTPDSYIPEEPRPNPPMRAQTYNYKDKKPVKYTFTGETITLPGQADNGEESSAMGAAHGQAGPSRSPEQSDDRQPIEEDLPAETSLNDGDKNDRRRSRRRASRMEDPRAE